MKKLHATYDVVATALSQDDTARREFLKLAGTGVAPAGDGHVDLYDRVTLIPRARLVSFFGTHLVEAGA